MIKLIASDLDGTLLDGDKRLPPGFHQTLQKLRERSIPFVAASGRSFETLKENFAPYSGEMTFICDNGACLAENGKVVETDCLPLSDVLEIAEACRDIPEASLLFCGVHVAYALSESAQFIDEVAHYYVSQKRIFGLDELTDDICKIAVYDPLDASKNVYPALRKRLGDRFTMAVSGLYWMDVMKKGVNKGKALRSLQQRLGVLPEETMAFGDFYNDVELLQQAAYSFVMENANEDMRRYGNYVAPSNREHGVLKVIEKYVFDI